MSSPFPGMDPYLESHWGDVHTRMITYASDQLQPLLPRDLRARVEERVAIEDPGKEHRSIVPDVRIVEGKEGKRLPQHADTGVAVPEPFVVNLDEPGPARFLEIREASAGHRLITVLEVLSLSNKVRGHAQDKYLEKRHELAMAGVSLVEIDLLRGGLCLLPFPQERLPAAYRTHYQVCVRRGWRTTKVEVYRVPLRQRLPIIKVPLRQTDADVPLDLQALIDLCYKNGSYEDDIDYQVEPEPPLARADARWAAGLLRQRGLRHARRRRSSNGT